MQEWNSRLDGKFPLICPEPTGHGHYGSRIHVSGWFSPKYDIGFANLLKGIFSEYIFTEHNIMRISGT